MIPLQPVSVKFADQERSRIKTLAQSLGWSESQVIRESVSTILDLIDHPDSNAELKMVGMARQALHYKRDTL